MFVIRIESLTLRSIVNRLDVVCDSAVARTIAVEVHISPILSVK